MSAPTTSESTQDADRAHGSSLQRFVSRLVVAFGGGVNSTAMLVEMHKRGIRPDLILFADTGGERPETYETVTAVSAWCADRGLPEIVTVRGPGKTLEQDCLVRNALPSIAYGFKTCSQRWKMQPQQKFLNAWKAKGEHYRKAIGYDAGEERRMRDSDDKGCTNWYPLIEWGLWRDDCEAICRSEGLPTAKSSCFFCPSMKTHEILALKKEHPDLAARALAMEANAALTTVKGLGRNYAWRDLIKNDEDQIKLFPTDDAPEIPCGCYDG